MNPFVSSALQRELGTVTSEKSWKMGLDLGAATTVYQDIFPEQGGPTMVSCSVLPTLISYPWKESEYLASRHDQIRIGTVALNRRDHQEVISPFAVGPERQGEALLEFVKHLRDTMVRRQAGSPWGVVALPLDADPRFERRLRGLAGELFERTRLVKEPELFALAILSELGTQRAIVVDIGARGVRSSLVGPLWSCLTKPTSINAIIPMGGDAVDQQLKALLLEKYPDLLLTDLTVTRLKEKLSFVSPVERPARTRVLLGRSRRMIDIPDQIRESCEILVPVVMQTILEVLTRSPAVLVDNLLQQIYLVGGGAAIPGMAQRIHAELKQKGFPRARVHATKDPGAVLATGALKYALLTPDDAWEIPLFAYQPGM